MPVNLPTPGETPWGAELNTAITGIDADLQTHKGKRGVASGYASLDSSGKVPAAQLPAASGGTAPAESRYVPLIIFNGESNSGGYADNGTGVEGAGYPTAHEFSARPGVQIWDNNLMLDFEDLDIGTNNLAGHAGLDYGPWHGWELGLANQVEAGMWWNDPVYLVKTGQGGSAIGSWAPGSDYYVNRFLPRVRGAINLLHTMGKVPLIYLWYSMGVNDSNGGTPEAGWLAAVKELHARMRTDLGQYFPVFMTLFTDNGTQYNDSISAYAAEDNMVFTVSGAGCGMKDPAHWNYEGMKLLAQRFMTATQFFGQQEEYPLRQAATLHGINLSPPVADLPSLVVAPAALAFEEGAPGTINVCLSQVPTANATITVSVSGGNLARSPTSLVFTPANWGTYQPVTITSPDDTIVGGSRAGTVSFASVDVAASVNVAVTVMDADALPTSLVPFDWVDLEGTTTDISHQITATATSGEVGGQATVPVQGDASFAVVVDWTSSALSNAVVFILDEDLTSDYNWGNQYFASCIYHVGNTVYCGVSGSAPVNTGYTVAAYPIKMRGTRSGSDIVWASSPDGTNWTNRYTHAGCLAGKTTLHPRAVFAIPTVGQKITAYFDEAVLPQVPPTIASAPLISGASQAVGAVMTCSTGGWNGSPSSYAYQWKRNGTDIAGQIASTHTIVALDQGTTLTCTVTATNAHGSGSATAAGIAISAPTTPVTWTQLVNNDSPSAGQIRCTVAAVGGGIGDQIDLTQPFEIHVDWPSSALTQGMILCIDDTNDPTYQWDASQVFIICLYHYGNIVYASKDGGASQITTAYTVPAYPCKFKLVKSGNDLVYYTAAAAGSYGASFYTSTGALTGKTTGYLKVLHAEAGVGKNITVARG